MKIIKGIITLLYSLLISVSVFSLSPDEEGGQAILFKIIDENHVEVNGENTKAGKSWVEANKYIDPYKINTYRIINAQDYPDNAKVIVRSMAIVANTAGVDVEQVK
ncbi:hypothetical protein [Agaribacterium sp. ZY112]|uniref:hypothetical protein n=1 Tax=Agaribacterium sp. ZY112 TaxID=3233574 RepID=UPI003526B443